MLRVTDKPKLQKKWISEVTLALSYKAYVFSALIYSFSEYVLSLTRRENVMQCDTICFPRFYIVSNAQNYFRCLPTPSLLLA